MATLRFCFISEITIRDINPYIPVSSARAAALKPNWRKPLLVLVRINMMPIGDGSFYLYPHGVVRKASGTKVGDRVKVELQFDADYKSGPQHEMPPELEAALRRNKRAASNWKALPPSRQKEVLRYLARLKSPEAMKRNIEKTLDLLKGDRARFMGRAWEGGA